MKLSELIEMLEEFPDDAEVFIDGGNEADINIATLLYCETTNEVVICGEIEVDDDE